MIASALFRTGSWEPEITRLLAGATQPGTTVLDVGANIGASAIPLLAAFPDIHVLSFEPSPSVLQFLARTHEESRFRDRWEVIPKAATEQPGADITFTTFDCPGADVFDGLRDTGRTGALARQVTVPTTTVDTEWQSRGRPPVSVLKVDVEGAELGVLAGARACLAECRPVVLTEWYPNNFAAYGVCAGAMLEFADSVGYEVFLVPDLYRVTPSPALHYQLLLRENLMLLPKA